MHRKKPMGKQSYKAWRSVAVVLACICVFCLARWVLTSKSSSDGFSSSAGKTLIVHIFADTDTEYLENLKFFVEWGIPVQDQADYVIVVQSTDASTVGLPPPANPPNGTFHCKGTYMWPQGWCLVAACQATSYSSKCQVCATQERVL